MLFVARYGEPPPPEETVDNPTFTIASLNARWGLDLEDRPFGLVETLAAFDTDLVAVQEVFEPTDRPHPLTEVAAAHGYQLMGCPLSPSYIDPQPGITRNLARATGTWGIVLMSRLPVNHVEIVDLGRFIDRWDLANRSAIVASVEVDGRDVTVAVVHLSFALPNAVAQLRTLNRHLPARRRSVVVGDCNLWGPAAAAALGGRRRAVKGRTYPAHRPHSQLDHVLVGRGLKIIDGQVLESVGSDHLPVRATLALA